MVFFPFLLLLSLLLIPLEKLSSKNGPAPPGNRTRVARMGILHDTTTPAAPCPLQRIIPPFTGAAVVAEWLRRLTRNQMGSPRAGSNPAGCEIILFRLKKQRQRG